jgi:hypothetical protein
MSETLALPLDCPMHQEHQVECQECHSSEKNKININITKKNLTPLSIAPKHPCVPRAPGKTLGISRLQKKDQRPTCQVQCHRPLQAACQHCKNHTK